MVVAPVRTEEIPDLRAIRDDEMSLGTLLAALKRRRGIFLYLLIGMLGLVTVYCLFATRRYQATGQIQIQKDSAGAFGLESSVMGRGILPLTPSPPALCGLARLTDS